MDAPALSFLTPYWSGADMMRLHLASIRRFYPDAPILVSKRGGDATEMAAHRREFHISCWLEDCGYTNAYLRLLERCQTQYVCIADHDTVLLATLDPLLARLAAGQCDLVGVEERIRMPQAPGPDGWLRFAPGCTAANFLLFDWRRFKSRWGLGGIFGHPAAGARHFEFDHGIGQRLERHHYLMPYHAPRYGLGNLLRDETTPVVWHQWYGSYRTRLPDAGRAYGVAAAGEQAFLADFPNLDLDGLCPAWGPGRDLNADREALSLSAAADEPPSRARRWASRHLRVLAARLAVRRDRSRLP